MNIRIVLADDHTLLRECLHQCLEARPGFHVVGEADDSVSLGRKIREQAPDVVIMDATLPEDEEASLVSLLQELNGSVRIIALADTLSRQTVLEMMKMHVSGYLPKICSLTELEEAVHAAMAGRVYLSSHIAGHVVDGYLRGSESSLHRLTDREREVVHLLAEGKPVKEIAQMLHISIKTVNTHRRQLMLKLKLKNTAELVRFSIREGLIS